MGLLIVLAGLAVIAAAATFTWFKKASVNIWASYLFGFLLVLIGGPLRSSLSALSVTSGGVEVSFKPVDESTSQEKIREIQGRAKEVLLAISTEQQEKVAGPVQQTIDQLSQTVIDQLIVSIKALGFIPTQIIGSPKLEPGTVLSFVSGKSITIAASREAFPTLRTESSSVALPASQILRAIPGTKGKVQVMFRCEGGAQIVEASSIALTGSMDLSALTNLSKDINYFVVQSVLRCKKPRLASSSDLMENNERNTRDFDYSAEDAILGYKLVSMNLGK
jgi:hypothetical protein